MPGSLRTHERRSTEPTGHRRQSGPSESLDGPIPSSSQEYGWENRLAQAIVSMVIPKLQSTHPSREEMRRTAAIRTMRLHADAERFTGMVLSESRDDQWQFLLGLRDSGLDAESIFLDVMTPAIRHLGDLWNDDRLSFIDVTTKSAYLQQMMRRLGSQFQTPATGGGRRILLAPAPGEQHTFGLFLLAEMFLKGGWDTVIEPAACSEQLCQCVATQSYDAIGLSAGSAKSLGSLPACVTLLRSATMKPDMKVFLGGWAFQSPGQSLDGYRADLIETDARIAVQKADMLCPVGERIAY